MDAVKVCRKFRPPAESGGLPLQVAPETGYIAGPNDEPGNPGGDDFSRLHEWFVTSGRSSTGRPGRPGS
jgi:hypothetical protein